MSFQKKVLIIGAIVLSVMLFFISLAMKGLKKAQQYPPEISACPDYWMKNSENVCVPDPSINQNMGSPTPQCNMFNNTKDKKQWANECGIIWDGITNI